MVYFLCKAYDSDRQNCYFALSLPVRGAWIEMLHSSRARQRAVSRSPCGERGLKFLLFICAAVRAASLPVRGAWIEILFPFIGFPKTVRRSPCGERGLKFFPRLCKGKIARRSPCGERGLKCLFRLFLVIPSAVAPRAGSVD